MERACSENNTASRSSRRTIFVARVRDSVARPAANWIRSSVSSGMSRFRRRSATSGANRSCAVPSTTRWGWNPTPRTGRSGTDERRSLSLRDDSGLIGIVVVPRPQRSEANTTCCCPTGSMPSIRSKPRQDVRKRPHEAPPVNPHGPRILQDDGNASRCATRLRVDRRVPQASRRDRVGESRA